MLVKRKSLFSSLSLSLYQGEDVMVSLYNDVCFKFPTGSVEGIPALVSSLGPSNKEQLLIRCSAGPGDLILFAVGHPASVNKTLDRLRMFVAHELGLIDTVSSDQLSNVYGYRSAGVADIFIFFFLHDIQSKHSILWITDFPMFEWNDSEQRLEVCLLIFTVISTLLHLYTCLIFVCHILYMSFLKETLLWFCPMCYLEILFGVCPRLFCLVLFLDILITILCCH